MSFLLGVLAAGAGIGFGIASHNGPEICWATAAATWTASAYFERKRAERYKALAESK